MDDRWLRALGRARQISETVAGWLSETGARCWQGAKSALASARARANQARANAKSSAGSNERRPRVGKPANDDRSTGLWARTPVQSRDHAEGVDTLIFVGARPVVDVRLEMFSRSIAVDVRLEQEEPLQRVVPIPQGAVSGELPELSIEPESIRLRWKLQAGARRQHRHANVRQPLKQPTDTDHPAAGPLRSALTIPPATGERQAAEE